MDAGQSPILRGLIALAVLDLDQESLARPLVLCRDLDTQIDSIVGVIGARDPLQNLEERILDEILAALADQIRSPTSRRHKTLPAPILPQAFASQSGRLERILHVMNSDIQPKFVELRLS